MIEFLVRKRKKSVPEPDAMPRLFQDSETDHVKMRTDAIERFIRSTNSRTMSLVQYSVKCLSHIARDKEISQGAFFVADQRDGKPCIRFVSGFASPARDGMADMLELGEGFPGQVARDGRLMNISDIPEDYFMIESGLGKGKPVSLILFPVKHEGKVIAVIELSSFHRFSEADEEFFNSISPSIAEQIIKCKNYS